MRGLTIAWEYLTGYAVATDPTDRERAEWPPHPARVFMALAAAWFESGEDPAEGEALRWLETLGDPELVTPPLDPGAERSLVTTFVPVNDQIEASAAPLQSVPRLTRMRQARHFPRVWVGNRPCAMEWPDAAPSAEHREALQRLCRKVTRIGHSSSLVAMWLVEDANATPDRETAAEFRQDGPASGDTADLRWSLDDLSPTTMLRSGGAGTLDLLTDCVDKAGPQRAADLDARMERLDAERAEISGKGARERRAEIDRRLETLREERAAIEPRPMQRPVISRHVGYRCDARGAAVEEPPTQSCFDGDLLILSGDPKGQPSLVATLAATKALRDMLMKSVPQPAVSWITGHAETGEPNRSGDGCHLACLPLAHVGHRHADGRLLGLALALPRSLDRRERARVLGPAIIDAEAAEPRAIRLLLGRWGEWIVRRRDHDDVRATLQAERWTGGASGAREWASVTPVVLDRFPKSDRIGDAASWREEVAAIVAASCRRIGLPDPETVDLDTTAFVRGVPRASARQHRLRGTGPDGANRTFRDGDGFPPYPARGTGGPRPQIHVRLRFAHRVVGPILLGVGRHNGYGLCMPLSEARS